MIIVLYIKLISELLPSFKTQEVKVHRFLFHQRKESEITIETRKYVTDLQLVGILFARHTSYGTIVVIVMI